MSQISPEQARERLETAQALSCTTQRAARTTAYVGALTTAGVGVLIGFVLAASWAFAPHHGWAFAISFIAYGVALCLLIWWQRTHQRVFERGFSRAYTLSFVATLVLYAFGVAWLIHHASGLVVLPYCVLVALPMLVAAARLLRSGQR